MVADPRLHGSVADQAWGATLGAFAIARASGELTLRGDDGKHYTIGFRDGAIARATSPLVADSVARLALTSHLVSSSQVSAIAKAVAQTDRDEVEVVGELARLSPEQLDGLRHRLLVQRAARTFAVERGEFAFDATFAPPEGGLAIAAGAAIFVGARMHLTEQRLAEDLRSLGTRFVLRDDVDLAAFGFAEDERPIVQALRVGTSLPELDAHHRELEPRTAQAAIYALVACGVCEGVQPRPRTRELPPLDDEAMARARTITFEAPRADDPALARAATVSSSPTIREPAPSPSGREWTAPAAHAFAAAPPRATTPPAPVPRARTITGSSPAIPRTTTPRRSNRFVVRETIAVGLAQLDQRADHFAVLGVAREATLDAIRSAYVALACQLHPEKLPRGLAQTELDHAHRLFGHINMAFAVLTDPERRASYVEGLGGSPRLAQGTDTAVDKAMAAAGAAKRGLAALKHEDTAQAVAELTRATELAPGDVDHAAMLAWARFCAAPDKHRIAPEVRRALDRAIQKSANPVPARFYLGRVERMLGRVREALHHFHEVLLVDPGHRDAAAEIRLLEPREVRR